MPRATWPIVDLVVGTALFRDEFVAPSGRGHVDLPRLERAGVRLIGLTVAATWPDLRGSLSRWHFRSLGLPPSAVTSPLAIAEWSIDRIHAWIAASSGRLRLVDSAPDVAQCENPGEQLGVLIGVQGGHVLESDPANVARLHARGVRMLAPAHVMDNALVGSGTGRTARGLTALGREVVAELEAHSVVVDLAHMSVNGIEETLGIATRPPVVSHTGLVEVHGAPGRWRRYSAATRNIPLSVAREVGARGGLVGVTLATELIGGNSLANVVSTVTAAVAAAGEDYVAIGSDMDGALRMVTDAEGLPALGEALLRAGVGDSVVAGVMGANAVRFLRGALPASPRGGP